VDLLNSGQLGEWPNLTIQQKHPAQVTAYTRDCFNASENQNLPSQRLPTLLSVTIEEHRRDSGLLEPSGARAFWKWFEDKRVELPPE
jgi:hypothetical protein